MKKILFLLSLSLLITGCTSTKTINDNNKINELEQKIIELQDQQASTSDSSAPTTTASNIDTSTPKVEATKEKQVSKSPETPQQPTIAPTTPTKSNDQICQDSYGLNSGWDGTRGSNGGLNCVCNNGYAWNTQRTGCVDPLAYIAIKATVCPESSYRSENFADTCYCAPGYILNNNKNGCINPSTVQTQQSIKTEAPEIKIAKCEAEKTQQSQTYQQLENAMKQMTYQNTLKQLEEISPCGEAFYPDAISACREGQYKVAKNAATDLYNQEHSKNLIKIQNNYINCLNQ